MSRLTPRSQTAQCNTQSFSPIKMGQPVTKKPLAEKQKAEKHNDLSAGTAKLLRAGST